MDDASVQPTDRDRRLKRVSWLLLVAVVISELVCVAILAALVFQ